MLLTLGYLSISKLNEVNEASNDIQDHWLLGTQILGDLNNYTSDFRATESGMVLASDPELIAKATNDINQLTKLISLAEKKYVRLNHQSSELVIYQQFLSNWSNYETVAQKVIELSKSGNKKLATQIYFNESRAAYSVASDSLSKLTTKTVHGATEASNHADRIFLQSQKLLFLALFFAICGVALALAYIRRYIAVPLIVLADKMHSLAANNTDVILNDTSRPDEIGQMSKAVAVFKDNAIALNQSRLRLMEEASHLENQLHLEQRLTTLQRNFISMVSHEFRTPLTIIDGQAQRLQKNGEHESSEIIHDRSVKIRAAVLRLTKVMDGLLQSTKVATQDSQLPFHPHTTDIKALLKDAIHVHMEMSPHSHIALNASDSLPRIFADQELLFLVFSNLLSNSIKYSKRDPEIIISAQLTEETIQIEFKDEGMGIPSKDLEAIFSRYQRGSNVSSIEGTGIGLHLSKMIIELHHGSIAVKSVEGEGSRFLINLPINPN